MILEHAKIYLKRGICVIPVGRDKKPLIDWKKYQTQKSTEAELDLWYKQWPDMQIAAVTGKISGIIVVDVDDPTMDTSWLPETAIANTGSGGWHYYYSYVPGIGNKARIKENIDIRGDGGYILLPPSHNLKGEYSWIKKVNPLPYFPANLFIKQEWPTARTESEYHGQSEGGRNDGLARYIGHLLAKVHPSEWNTLAWREAVEANLKNSPPLDERELKTIFDSIAGKERGNPAQRWYKTEEKVPYKPQVKMDYPYRYTWGTMGLDESLAIIKRGNFIIVGAKRSSGKTTYTFDMACKNALLGHQVLYISLEMDETKIKEDFARKYAGITIAEEYHYTIPEHKQTAFEKKIAEINSITNLYFRGMRRGNGTSWGDIVKLINEFDSLDLVMIDNLDLIEGQRGELNNDRQIRITKTIMNFTEETKIPLVLIHHHRKGGQKDFGSDELSGSGKVGDNADIILKIQRCQDPEAGYPDKYKTTIFQQKGRGYPDAIRSVYFVRGSFEDNAPPEDNYFNSLTKTYDTGNSEHFKPIFGYD